MNSSRKAVIGGKQRLKRPLGVGLAERFVAGCNFAGDFTPPSGVPSERMICVDHRPGTKVTGLFSVVPTGQWERRPRLSEKGMVYDNYQERHRITETGLARHQESQTNSISDNFAAFVVDNRGVMEEALFRLSQEARRRCGLRRVIRRRPAQRRNRADGFFDIKPGYKGESLKAL
jgi:hypothetical protein